MTKIEKTENRSKIPTAPFHVAAFYITAVFAALALTACAAPQQGGTAAPVKSQTPVKSRTTEPPAAIAARPPQTSEQKIPAEPTAPVVTLPPINDDPAHLLGLGPDDLTALLGTPELIRREQPVEIWQYRGADCVFDVFLYDQAGSARVTYLEARDNTARKTPPRPCLNALLRARQAS